MPWPILWSLILIFPTLLFTCSVLVFLFCGFYNKPETFSTHSLCSYATMNKRLIHNSHHLPTHTQTFMWPTLITFRLYHNPPRGVHCSQHCLRHSSQPSPIILDALMLFIFLVYYICMCSFAYCLSPTLECKLIPWGQGCCCFTSPPYPQCREWYPAHNRCSISTLDELMY